MASTTLSILSDGLLGLAIIVGGVVLLALGKIDSATGIALITAGAAVAKGANMASVALKVPAPTQTPPPTQAP